MATNNSDNNIFARLNAAVKGSVVGNTYALYDDNGLLGYQSAKNGKTWYVDPQNGSDAGGTFTGKSWATAFASMTSLDSVLGDNDTIMLSGVLRQQWTAPLGVFDVTVIGAANKPRQATSGGVPTSGGAYWYAPAAPVAVTPLLTLREQGWMVYNICFQAHTDAAAIRLQRAESATYPDPSHAIIMGCYFVNGKYHIEDNGGCFNISIIGNTFRAATTTAIVSVSGAGIAQPSQYRIEDNYFILNVNAIIIGLDYSTITRNRFSRTTMQVVKIDGGVGYNHIVQNSFDIAAADFDPVGGLTGTATDVWSNTLKDAIETGLPAN